MTTKRGLEFHHSRGYTREVLSRIFKLPPLEVPLKALPGQPPELPNGYGFVSFSHCNDALLIGWSPFKIGVDIERRDRTLKAKHLEDRLLSKNEKLDLKDLELEKLQAFLLKSWVIKEAAIKWQRGNIAQDLKEWQWIKDQNTAIHTSLFHEINVQQITLNSWHIGIAYQIDRKDNLIICEY